ncbi:MAG: hypothetical protein CSA22_09920 [Deltaproteobacteria bacterium]|nr:MAG: hypothetical protein CSA22_09920 [Deltaproteobacteria bacterium]
MNPWILPWWGLFKGPLSGDVIQDISPITSWLSPQFEINFAGNRRIEAKIVADVASYGKQLSILTKAVMELADGNTGEAVEKLRKLIDQIEKVKHQHNDSLEQNVKAALNQLKKHDPNALKNLIEEYIDKSDPDRCPHY